MYNWRWIPCDLSLLIFWWEFAQRKLAYALHLTYPHKTYNTEKIFEEYYETTTKASYYDADETKSNIASTPPSMNSIHTRTYTARKHHADACTCIHSWTYLYIQDSKLLYYHQFTYYLIREIKIWLNINYITVHNNTYTENTKVTQ